MFKIGDTVECVSIFEDYPDGLVIGEKYMIENVSAGYVKVSELRTWFSKVRFTLIRPIEALHNIPKSGQPYPYPEDDESREREAERKLRAYKKGMRDFLYGTTSDGEAS